MSTAAITEGATVTPEDLLRMSDERLYELVDGRLVEKQMGGRSYLAATRLAIALGNWAAHADSGGERGSVIVEATYRCFPHDPGMVRRPDVSFISRERLAPERMPAGHITVAPDLAVEVVSPHEVVYELDRKIGDYFQAGVRRVWVLNPDRRIARVHRPDGVIDELGGDAELTGEGDVLPGFGCSLGSVFVPTV